MLTTTTSSSNTIQRILWRLLWLLPAFVQGQRVFSNPGELRVAVDRYMTNQSEEVIAEYGSISDWNVSLVDDMSGTS